MLNELLIKTRSHRTFDSTEIDIETLESLINAAHLGGSARNSQTLRYTLVSSQSLCHKIFPHTAWAGAIPWSPTLEEGPKAYILISTLKENLLSPITLGIDIGIACQNILLKATELGFGGCLIGAFNKLDVSKTLDLDMDTYNPQILVALGKPTDKVILTKGNIGNLKYHRDVEENVHYVPKLSLETLILKKF
ncbi:MAG: nitroreductase family protein [Cetobacterium somerae]|uniref:Nitroreductase family protein n=1 Tax=Cetobacterium somerae ATCC BAA-474 TaxID=1319815 RepID=U7VG05_9FUSO|nr:MULTISPECIES: nitroreductase family protein [Cetobacterium]ERT70069.1 nitroreductase family protein [Cetobacterium somerae ATCC BAA-474]MBC2853724.1 nitroreductase family protein [Cetobacterium sp. 2G large]